jgi:hypothetical protein
LIRSPLKIRPAPRRLERQFRVMRSGFRALNGGRAQEVPIELRMSFKSRIKARKLSK